MGKFYGPGVNYNGESGDISNDALKELISNANPQDQVLADNPVISASDRLAIDTTLVPVPVTSTPEPVGPVMGQDEDGGSFEMQPDKTEEEEAQAVLDQQEMERSYAMYQSVDINRDEVSDVVGEEHAEHFTEGMVNLENLSTDDVGMSYNQESRMEELRVMSGGFQQPSENPQRDNFVDPAKTIRLSNPQLFSFMNAVETSGDSRGLVVKPMLKVLALGAVESKLGDIFQAEALMPAALLKEFSSAEAADILGVSQADLPSMEGESALGKMISEEWAKIVQRDAIGADGKIDAHLDPDNKITKEAQEQLGLWAKQTYAMAFPHLFEKKSTVNKAGNKRTDYVLTSNGQKMMEQKRYFMMRQGPMVRPQVTSGDNSNSDNVPFANLTGKHYRGPRKPEDGFVNEQIAQSRLAAVQHMGTEVRMKTGMLFSVIALGKAKSYQMVDNKVVLNFSKQEDGTQGEPIAADMGALDILSLGQDAADSINNAGANALLKVEAIDFELTDLKMNKPKSPKIFTLERKMKALLHFAEKADAPPVNGERSWRENMYMRRMTQQLAMVQDIAEFHETAIRFPNYVQSGSGRIGYKPTVMNPQTHKFARQMYGSATKYTIKPGSKSYAEQAMLLTMGSHLFADGWVTPDTAYNNMRTRITNKKHQDHPKVLAIAAVGRKLKAILAQYNVNPTVDALKAMGTTPENVVHGVDNVFNTVNMANLDTDVRAYLTSAFKHPDEFLHLVEEAVELGNYMDSLSSGKPFMSTMATVEVDGIQNGVAAVGLQLGIKDIMYRIGVMSEDPSKVIAEYKDVLGTLRDVFADNMQSRLTDVLESESFLLDHGSVAYSDMKMFLDAAIQNSAEFLKPPIMTFTYGQAIESMGGTMLKAITTSSILTKMIENSPYSINDVARMLHKVVADGLYTTLDPQVINFSESLKDLTGVAMVANEEIRYQRPTGSWTSLNDTMWKTDDDAKAVRSSIRDIDDKVLASTQFQPTSREMSGISPKDNTGSTITSAALAQVTMATDGAAVVNLLSGNMYEAIQRMTGQQVPYVTTIYDAIKGDLGSLIPMLQGVNKVWQESIINYDLLAKVQEGTLEAHKRGHAKLVKNSENELGNQLAKDQAQIEFLDDYIKRMTTDGNFEKEFKATLGHDHAKFMHDYHKIRFGPKRIGGDNYRMYYTNNHALRLFNLLTPAMEFKLKNFKKVAADAKSRRHGLAEAINNSKINQYHADFLKSFDYYSPSVAPTGGRIAKISPSNPQG